MKTNPAAHFFGTVIKKEMATTKRGTTVLNIVLGEQLPNKYNKVLFEVYGNKIPLFQDVKERDIIQIEYNVEGNEISDGRIFTNLHVLGFEMLEEFKPNLFDDVKIPDNKDLYNDLEF